jgi:hypothetical protein
MCHPQAPDGLHRTVAGLRGATGPARGCGARRSVGVQWIRLPLGAAARAVGSVDLDDHYRGRGQHAGQPGSIGTGAFDTHHDNKTERAHPVQQRAVAGGRGRELAVSQFATQGVDDRGMMGARMGIDAAVHFPVFAVVGHGGDVPPFSLNQRWARAGRAWRTRQ